MAECDHPGRYKQAHAELPTAHSDSPEWKVALYILTANQMLWNTAQRYIRPEMDQVHWRAMLADEGLSIVDRALVELAGCLYGSGHPVDVGALCANLDEHHFEVAMKAIRLNYDFARGRAPL